MTCFMADSRDWQSLRELRNGLKLIWYMKIRLIAKTFNGTLVSSSFNPELFKEVTTKESYSEWINIMIQKF